MKAKLLTKEEIKLSIFPDIAIETRAIITGTLEKVGMEKVELAIKLQSGDGEITQIPAFANLYVSLDDPHKKGIHMSRLLLQAHKIFDEEILSYKSLGNLVRKLKESQADMSLSAFVEIQFDYMLRRPALVSNNDAWRSYPVVLKAEINHLDEISFTTSIRITYSSTCPCSAALSRQLIQEEFLKIFSDKAPSVTDIYNWLGREESQVATPHSQRSYADIDFMHTEESKLHENAEIGVWQQSLNLDEMIDGLEKAIATPVQAAVKREDEQEFARLNGRNFMFSEDAARKLKFFCESLENLSDFSIKVQHLESLHAHNAVAFARKSSS
ncbi:MAG: GTP cyclohydrolase FolE2 [bacterium]